jgi:hypothetical protein
MIAAMKPAEQVAALRPPRPFSPSLAPLELSVAGAGKSTPVGVGDSTASRIEDPSLTVAARAALEEPSSAEPSAAVQLQPERDRSEPAAELAEGQPNDEQAGLDPATLVRELEGCLETLDQLETRYGEEIPALVAPAADHCEAIRGACSSTVRRAQDWVSSEQVLSLRAFQDGSADTLRDMILGVALEPVPGPYGLILGTVYGGVMGLWETSETNREVDEAIARSEFLNAQLGQTSDAVIRGFMEMESSHVRAVSRLEGSLEGFFGPEGGVETSRFYLVSHLGQLADLHQEGSLPLEGWRERVADDRANVENKVAHYSQRRAALARAVAAMSDAAGRAPAQGDAAIGRLLDLYLQFRTEQDAPEQRHAGRVVTTRLYLSGIVSGRHDGMFEVEILGFSLGDGGPVTPDVRQHLMGKTVADLEALRIWTTADLLIAGQSAPNRHVTLWNDNGSGRQPESDMEGAERALSSLVQGWSGGDPHVDRSQLAIQVIWGLLLGAPIREHMRLAGSR